MLSASDSAHYYNFSLKLKGLKQAQYFLQEKIKDRYPKIIKFEKNGRAALDSEIYFGRFSKVSFFFSLAQNQNFYKLKMMGKINYAKFIISNYYKKFMK